MATPSPFRKQLAEHLRDQARWREEKTAEHADDERNSQSATALNRLADYVENAPEGHPALVALDAMQSEYELDVFAPGEEGGRMISRYGFDFEPEADEFLDQLAAAEARELGERE